MFKQITMVVLTDAPTLLNYQLPWPEKVMQKTQMLGDLSLITRSGIVKDASVLIESALKQDQFKCSEVLLPIYYHMQQEGGVKEWLLDLTKEEYQKLTDLIQEVIPGIQPSGSCKLWYLTQSDLQPTSSELLIHEGMSISAKEQEIEMMLYQNPINRDREANQKRPISGVWVRENGKVACANKPCATNTGFQNLLSAVRLEEWLKNPSIADHIIVGEDVGDQEVEVLKSVFIGMLESGHVGRIRIISPGVETIYFSSLFNKMWVRFKGFFSGSMQYN